MSRENYKAGNGAEMMGGSTRLPLFHPSSTSSSSRGHGDEQSYTEYLSRVDTRDSDQPRERDRDRERGRDRERERERDPEPEPQDDRDRYREAERERGRERERDWRESTTGFEKPPSTGGRDSPSLLADLMRPISQFTASKRVAQQTYIPYSQQQHLREQRDKTHAAHNEGAPSQPHMPRQSTFQAHPTHQTEHAGRAQDSYKANGSTTSVHHHHHNHHREQGQHQRNNTKDSVGSNNSSFNHSSRLAHNNERERERRMAGPERKASSDVEMPVTSRMTNLSQRSHQSHKTTTTSRSSDEREMGVSSSSRPLSPDQKGPKRNLKHRKPPPVFQPSPPPTPPKQETNLPSNGVDTKREVVEDKARHTQAASLAQPTPQSVTTYAPAAPAQTASVKHSRPRDETEHVAVLPRDTAPYRTTEINVAPEPIRAKTYPPTQQSNHQVQAAPNPTNVSHSLWNPLASITSSLKVPVVPVVPAQDKPAPPTRSMTAPVARTDSRTHGSHAAQQILDVKPESRPERSEPALSTTRFNSTVQQPQPKPASSAFATLTSFVRPTRTPSPNPHASLGEMAASSKSSLNVQQDQPSTGRSQAKKSVKRSRSPSPLAARESSEDYVNVSPVTEIPPVQPQGLLYQVPPRSSSPTPPTTRPAEGLYGPRPPKSAHHGVRNNESVTPSTHAKISRTPSPHGQPQAEASRQLPPKRSFHDLVGVITKSRSPSPRVPATNVDSTQQAKLQALQAQQTVPLPAPPPEAHLPELPAPAVPPARSRSPQMQMSTQPHIPQYAPPPPPFPPNPPNTPVLAPKPRIASQTQSMLIPALLANAGSDSTPPSRSLTPPTDDRANATIYSSDIRQSEAARASPSPLQLSSKEILNVTSVPLPPAVEALRKGEVISDAVSQAQPQPQSGVIRRTPPPVHPSRAGASVQVPGPAVLTETQPQSRVVQRTPPPSQPSRPAAYVTRDREAPASYNDADNRSDSVLPTKSTDSSSKSRTTHELATHRTETQDSNAPQGSSLEGELSASTRTSSDAHGTRASELRNTSFISGNSSSGSHNRVAPPSRDVISQETTTKVAPPPVSQTNYVGAQITKPIVENVPATSQASDRKYESSRVSEASPPSNNATYAKLFTSVSKPSEPPRVQAVPDNAPAYVEHHRDFTGRPQTQTRPSDTTAPSTSSAEPFAMGAAQRNQKIETSDANPPVRAQAAAYGRPSAIPDDSHNNKLPTDWREAIDRAMRNNHVQDTPVLHASAAASTIPTSVTNAADRAGPERFPYVEAEVEATPPERAVPEKPATFVSPGKRAAQDARAAEDVSNAQVSQRKHEEPDATRAPFDTNDMRQVQPSKHEARHQPILTFTNEVDPAPAPSKQVRPEPRREDSSNRQSTIAGNAPRSRSPVPRKRVPVDSITANIQVDAPMVDPHPGVQAQSTFGAPLETVMKQAARYPEHAESQKHVSYEGAQTFFGGSKRNLLIDHDRVGHADSHSYSATDNESTGYLRAASPEPMSYGQQEVFTSNDPYEQSSHHHATRETKKAKSSGHRHEGRADKRRATSPLPAEERSASPTPLSPAIYPKALPENPAQIHLATQAKRLAMNETYRPPTPPIPSSHYQKKRSNDALPSSQGFLKEPTHLIYPDTSTSDGQSLSGKAMLMHHYKHPSNHGLRSSNSMSQAGSTSTRALYPPSKTRREERELPALSPTSPSSGSFDDMVIDDYDPDDEGTQTPPTSSSRCSTPHNPYPSNMDNGSYTDHDVAAVRHPSRPKVHHSKTAGSSRIHRPPPPPEPDYSSPRYQQRRRQTDGSSSRSERSNPRVPSRNRHDYDRPYNNKHGHGKRPHRSMSEKVMRDTTVPLARSKSAPPHGRRANKGGFWKHVGMYVRVMMSKFFHWGQY